MGHLRLGLKDWMLYEDHRARSWEENRAGGPHRALYPPSFPARLRRLHPLPRSKRSRWHAQHFRLRFPAAIAEQLLSRAEAGGETAFFSLFSLGILIFFTKTPMYNPDIQEPRVLPKDSACRLVGSVSVPREQADRLKSPSTGANPGKAHKAEMGGEKRDEVIKKRLSRDSAGSHGFALFSRLIHCLLRGSFCLCHPRRAGRGCGEACSEQRRSRGKLSHVPALLGHQSSCLYQLRWSKGDAVPPGVPTRLGTRSAWVRCHSALILHRWLNPGFLLPGGSQHLQ